MAKKMIEGGELVPSCNLEVDWTAYDSNEIIDEQSLFKILKDFLWNRSERYGETYPMFDLKILNNESDGFEEKYIDQGTLIPSPTKKQPFQLIHEHTLEDAFYTFEYFDNTAPLIIEYQTYDEQKFLTSIMQKGKNCQYDSQGDGGTQDQFVTFRFLNKNGKIQSVRSSAFASLPLEFNDDSEDEHIKNLQKVAKNFFNEVKTNLQKDEIPKPRYFEFKDKESSKFWEISLTGKKVTVHYGKIGAAGQNIVKELATPADAITHSQKIIGEKIKKGYKEKKN